MGVCKSALEASVKYLARDLGAKNIRVNAISAGPIKTLAASAIGDAKFLYKWNADHSFLKRNVDINEAEQEPKSTSSSICNMEDNFEEEFNLLDEDEQEDSNDQNEEMNDFEEDAEELKTKAKKRKETLDTDAVQNETQLCLIPESSPMKKSRMLNKRMKMDMSFKSRMRNWKNEDLALLSKDFNPKSFSLDFSPRNIASFSLTWPIVPYKPNEILKNLQNTLDLL